MEENKTVKDVLCCGFGKKEITPPLGSPMVGYYKTRFSKGVIDPLFARGVLFESSQGKGVILTLDICLITKDLATEIRQTIADGIGVDPDAVLINLSHTHTGPLTGKDFASETMADPNYIAYLKQQAYSAVEAASKELAPARLFYGKTEARGISFIRRYRMKDGSIKTNPADPEQIDCALGEPNEDLRLLKIVREDAEDIYLVHFGTHADTVGGSYISADYPGYVCSILENAIPNSKCMFLLAPQGDVNHWNSQIPMRGVVKPVKNADDYREAACHARYMGRVIAGQILSICDKMEEIEEDGLRFGSVEMHFPTNKDSEGLEEAKMVNELYLAGRKNEIPKSCMSVVKARRIVKMENAPLFFTYSAYALRIGDFVFAGLPGEPFTEIGRRIYDNSPFRHMMVCCQTNAACGYLGTSKAYDEGGYETTASVYKKGVDDIVVNSMTELLKKVF